MHIHTECKKARAKISTTLSPTAVSLIKKAFVFRHSSLSFDFACLCVSLRYSIKNELFTFALSCAVVYFDWICLSVFDTEQQQQTLIQTKQVPNDAQPHFWVMQQLTIYLCVSLRWCYFFSCFVHTHTHVSSNICGANIKTKQNRRLLNFLFGLSSPLRYVFIWDLAQHIEGFVKTQKSVSTVCWCIRFSCSEFETLLFRFSECHVKEAN